MIFKCRNEKKKINYPKEPNRQSAGEAEMTIFGAEMTKIPTQ